MIKLCVNSQNFEKDYGITVQSLYNMTVYYTGLDITQPFCGSQIFLPWNFAKEL